MRFQGDNGKNYQIPRMSYEEIREHMSKKLNNGKRRTLTEVEVRAVVDQWMDNRSEEELNQEVVKKEIQKLEKKLARYNVPPVGSINEDKGEGTCRILYSQLNNASTRAVREIKMDKVCNTNDKFHIDINLFAEVGVNWKVGANNNFAN